MIYSTEVQHMCPVAKGAYHGPAPIPQEGKWTQAKEISDRVGDKVVKEMNYLMRENEEHLEEHFRKLDEALVRRRRKKPEAAEKEVALTNVTKLPVVSKRRKKHGIFARRRKTRIY